MKTTPIYIKSLELKNVRTFGETLPIKFERKNGTLPQWTLILGDNGIGKSTLLQCVAWMKPYLPYDKDDVPKEFVPAPIINDEENETLAGLVKRNSKSEVSAYMRALFVANRKLNPIKTEIQTNESKCETSMTISLKDSKLNDVIPLCKTSDKDKDVFYNDAIIIYAYSASRSLGKLNINDPELEDTIPPFIAEKTVLYDAEEILHAINYAGLDSKEKGSKKYKNYLKNVKEMLVTILPDVEEILDIEISAPKLESNKIKQGEIAITTKHGKKLPFDNFSLGYKTVISLTVDLAWRLFNKYPNSNNPLAEPAIVLIDEIDLHLHPIWQREIMANLSTHFKNIQFIATAHSPLMVQAALAANHVVLKYNEDAVEIINEPEGIDGWRIDQILTSEFFGLESSRGIKYEKLFNEREKLVYKKKLTTKEEVHLKRITKELSELPSGETPDEIKNRKLITEIVEKIKKNNVKIEL